jgi:hypothetical protein
MTYPVYKPLFRINTKREQASLGQELLPLAVRIDQVSVKRVFSKSEREAHLVKYDQTRWPKLYRNPPQRLSAQEFADRALWLSTLRTSHPDLATVFRLHTPPVNLQRPL